jgi:murein DD-endopeptidase MepM/ murein hydrolase activator NlpD
MMRFSRSGHQDRTTELDETRLARVDQPSTRLRLAVISVATVVPLVIAIGFGSVHHAHTNAEKAAAAAAAAAAIVAEVAPEPPPPPDPTVKDTLGNGEALGSALARHGVGADDVSSLVRDLKGVLEVRSLRAGAPFSVLVDGNRLTRFTFSTRSSEGVPRTIIANRLAEVEATPADAQSVMSPVRGNRATTTATVPRFDIVVEDANVQVVLEGIVGNVRGSLYNGVIDAGGDANLVNKFVDVFAWNIDFYRQTQPGDEFRALVEKRYADDGEERRFLGYGKVVAAEYVNAGTAFRGFAFETADKQFGGFFDENGESLERTFLRNPMEVTRITSSYGKRFHPLLKTTRKHEGIDYGAPVGTPIWTVADGVVVDARYSKGAGNMVTIQHLNGYKTEYFHMSRFADGLAAGARVKQKQVIGYVGSTGLSTGPHLHFGMLRGGAHLDPMQQKFANAKPIPLTLRSEFDAFVAPLLAQLQALTRA